MAVAAFQPAAVVYREEQNFDWWVYALVVADRGRWSGVGPALVLPDAATIPAAGVQSPRARARARRSLVGAGACRSILVVGVLRMTTEVTPTDLRVWFGWIPTYRRVVADRHDRPRSRSSATGRSPTTAAGASARAATASACSTPAATAASGSTWPTAPGS